MKEHIYATNSLSVTSTGTAVSVGLPNHPSGATLFPTMVRVSATAGAYVRIGTGAVTAANTDTLVQPGDAVVMWCMGMDTVSVLSVTGTAVVSIAALSNGCWDSGFTIKTLFASGAQGVWYDPSDFSTLFQDSAGTTPVTAAGQPVGKVLDKSGRGNHATQATAASRPILQQDASGFYYLNFDGVDDGMATASIDFTATDKMGFWAGFTQAATAVGVLCELSAAIGSNTGSFAFLPDVTGTGRPSFQVRGDAAGSVDKRNSAADVYTAPYSKVFGGALDIAGADVNTEVAVYHINGVTPGVTPVGTNAGAGTFGNYPLFIGRRGGTSFPFNGRLYGLIVVGAAPSAAQIASTERFIGGRMGISL